MDFDLRLLRHARALGEQGSFARAARSLHLTQPALSRSIQELERRTGIKLFDRNKSRVEPTDLGRVFLGHARELLGHAEALDRDVATMRGSGSGRLVIGSGIFPTVILMARAVAAFLRKNPGVGIRLVNDNAFALVAALRRRELDFVVAAPPEEDAADLSSLPLSPRHGYFLVRPGHPLLARPRLSLADVAACPIIGPGRLPATVTEVFLKARKDAESASLIPDVACESPEMMRLVAAATDHVLLSGLLPNAREIAAGELVVLPVIEPGLIVPFAIIRLESRTLPPITEELIREVIQADRAALATERELVASLFKPVRSVAAGQRMAT